LGKTLDNEELPGVRKLNHRDSCGGGGEWGDLPSTYAATMPWTLDHLICAMENLEGLVLGSEMKNGKPFKGIKGDNNYL
jgi:hypothetical protein